MPRTLAETSDGQLVEGAVADPPVVVVVEAVQLHHEDPDRAEEDRPEERGDVGGRGRRGDDAERRRPAPASRRRRAAAAAARRAGASRSAPVSPSRGRRLGRAAARGSGAGGAPAGLAWRSSAPVGVCGSSAAFDPSARGSFRSGFSSRASFEVGAGRGLVRRPRPRPWSAGSRAASCGPRGRSPASRRLDRGRVVALRLGEQAELHVGGGGPGLDRAGRVGVVDGAGDVAVGGGALAGVDLAVDQQRADQGDRGDPGDRQAGDREAEAALLGPAVAAGPRPRQLRAAGGDQDAGGEEEDRARARRSPRTSRRRRRPRRRASPPNSAA